MSQVSASLDVDKPVGYYYAMNQESPKGFPSSSSFSDLSVFSLANMEKNRLLIIIVSLVAVIILLLIITLGGTGFISSTVSDTLNFTADTITDLGIKGLQIFNGGVHDLTGLIMPISTKPVVKPATNMNQVVASDPSLNSNWCLIGESNSKRACVPLSNNNTKCLSGHIFPTLENCLVP